MQNQTIYQFVVKTLADEEFSLSAYRNEVLLIVNTATKCGHAPQLEQLETLYQRYKNKGFTVLAFPSAQFNQEPLEGKAIGEYCSKNYGITFPMLQKIQLRGDDAHPLYKFFADKRLNGKIASKPRWNYYKYLIGNDGKVIDYYVTWLSPSSKKITRAIENALTKN